MLPHLTPGRSRPCDNLSCLFFTALWLQQSQSKLVQEIQPAKDIDLTCYETLPIKSITCLQVGPMFLEWPVDSIARFDQSSPTRNIKKALFQLPHAPVGNRMLFNQIRYSVLQVGIRVATSPMEVCDVSIGTLGVSLGPFFPHRKTRSSNSNISGSSLTTTSCVSRRDTGRMCFSRLFRCWLRD